jgi:putative phosphoribosyl transferase
VAEALAAPLDLMLVRKLKTPGQEELAMGAVALGGVRVLNAAVIDGLSIPLEAVEQASRAELAVIERRNQLYRGGRPPPEVSGRCAILVDDGLATGSTMRAAVSALRRMAAARIVAAVPVAPPDTVIRLQAETDETVFLESPEPFLSVGRWYRDFPQLTDEEVRAMLARAGTAG